MLTDIEPPFDDLLRKARAGDAVALGSLLESYDGYLKIIAGSLLRVAPRAAVDVADVVQDTMLNACRGFLQFQGNDEPQLILWLRQILKNHVLTLLKKLNSPGQRLESLEASSDRSSDRAHQALAAPGSSPSTKVSREEQAKLTVRALNSLEPQHRQVLILHLIEDFSHKEIGRQMGCSEAASRMLLFRASRAFQQKLKDNS